MSAGMMTPEAPATPVQVDRSKELQETKSSLVQALGQPEFGIPADKVDQIADLLASTGVRTKEVVTRIANTSFYRGQEAAKANLEAYYKQKLETLQPAAKPAASEAKEPTQEKAPNPAETEIAKTMAWMKGEITKLREDLKQRDQMEKQRAVSESAKKIISEMGFDDPEAVLLLSRSETGFAFDPNDGSTLIAVKPGDPTEPLNGPATYTTAKDYFEAFGNTPRGMKYMRVPEASKKGAGVSGNTGYPAVKGPLHPDVIGQTFSQMKK